LNSRGFEGCHEVWTTADFLGHLIAGLVVLVAVGWDSLQMVQVWGLFGPALLSEHAGVCGVDLDW